jgi:hypothetical protein
MLASPEERRHRIADRVNDVGGHGGMKRRRQDFAPDAVRDGKVAAPAVLEEREPMAGLPVDARIDTVFSQVGAKGVAPVLGNA